MWGIECGGGEAAGEDCGGGGGEASAGRKKGAIVLSSTRTYQNPVQPEYRYAHTAPRHSKPLSPSLTSSRHKAHKGHNTAGGGGSTGVVTTGNNGTAGHNVHETPLRICACGTDIPY